jgi:hypothetical protein
VNAASEIPDQVRSVWWQDSMILELLPPVISIPHLFSELDWLQPWGDDQTLQGAKNRYA